MKAVFNNEYKLQSGPNKGQTRYAYRIVEATQEELQEWVDHPINQDEKTMRDKVSQYPLYRPVDLSLGTTGVVLIQILESGAIVATSLTKETQKAEIATLKALNAEGIDTSAAVLQMAKSAAANVDMSRFQLNKELAPIGSLGTVGSKKPAATKAKKKADSAELNPFAE
jgi:hypothetical protein